MSEEIKHLDIAEFQGEGYLQEVNRQFFHPLGLALEVATNADGSKSLGQIWDYRDDAEGIYFEGINLKPKADHIEELFQSRVKARENALGYVVQPAHD